LIHQKKTIIFLAAFLLLALLGASCKTKPSTPVIHEGVGVIEEVDQEASTIQINHEAIADYMPAMSMPYKVKDKSLLEKIKTGDKVNFTVEDSSAGIFVIDVKKQPK
jgi:Cu(I)/Ag(I) efflux system protein CusF